MPQPLVSVICLCHNHASWVVEALTSVWSQTYPAVELIVVDDASRDGSKEVITAWLQDKPQIPFLSLDENIGNCRAFNRGLAMARGSYIIDLAADDVLLPERAAIGVRDMEQAGPEWGVHFTDAAYIDVQGKLIKSHYKRNKQGELLNQVTQGWVYPEVVGRYFICTPSMMMRSAVLDQLGGYDESLAYEDFDFWVRSARQWKYLYCDQILVHKRVIPKSWSARQYDSTSAQFASTLKVCHKAQRLNQSKEEDRALGKRLRYELRQAIRYRQWAVGLEMLELKQEVWPVYWEDLIFKFLLEKKIPV